MENRIAVRLIASVWGMIMIGAVITVLFMSMMKEFDRMSNEFDTLIEGLTVQEVTINGTVQ